MGLRIAQAHTHFKEAYLRVCSQITKYYTFGGRRIAMRRDHILFFLATDHLGTTSVVLDAAGNVVDESRHYPYGTERWPVDSAFPTDYRFTGRMLDDNIDLYFMGARQYDPALGRWISPDSIVPDPTNPQSLNRYCYVIGNPLNRVDPSGHQDLPSVVQQAIDYFTGLGWELVGNAREINPYWNGPDLVFFVTDKGEVVQVLATELDVGNNVTRGTLGTSPVSGTIGGSMERLANSTRRFYDSSNDQLRLMCRTVYEAIKTGKAQNAIFTSAPRVSTGAQNVFNGVYRVGEGGEVIVDKALKDPTFWTKIGAGASTAWSAIRSAGQDLLNIGLSAPIILLPAFMVYPINLQDPLRPMWTKPIS